MHKKTNARPVRNFVLVISLLHIIIGVASINLSAFSLLGNCQYSAQAAGLWGSLANLLCASFGLTLSFETKRKVVLVYIFISACTVLTAAFQLATETAGLVVERQLCGKNSFFGRDHCKLECINTHVYIMVTAVASLFVSLFSSLVLSHGIQRLSTD
ncbi:hypothetical protein HOLleu_39971 [Holothuria leucospilota]|uniref:Uncharacterized protein n=1 Tax=Holothuria leucospilota TaxID=206669 RepID=A0A9Q1BBB8_HOLLE|nr:hypothetical protein HOLleu_39971 [Holothuria leucospilota]